MRATLTKKQTRNIFPVSFFAGLCVKFYYSLGRTVIRPIGHDSWFLTVCRRPPASPQTDPTIFCHQKLRGPGGRKILPFSNHIGMPPPQRVWFLGRFGLKTGIENCGIVWTYLSFQLQMNKKERVICKLQKDLKKSFCWRFILSNDDIIFAYVNMYVAFFDLIQVWKWVWIFEATFENGFGKWHFLLWNRVMIWRTGRHTLTKNS